MQVCISSPAYLTAQPAAGEPAFPANSTILDNFNRADGDMGANWTLLYLIIGTDDPLVISSNQVAAFGSDEYGYMAFNSATYGANVDAFIECPVIGTLDTRIIMGRITSLDSNFDGYSANYLESSTEIYLTRYDNHVGTELGASVTLNLADGDAVGIRCYGSTIRGYSRTSGTWTEQLNRTDATYGSAGYVGLYGSADDAVYRLDNLTGGTI